MAEKADHTKEPPRTIVLNQTEEDTGPPDGGIKAWFVVLGGFITYFVTFGLLNSFGTFQAYYGEHLLTEKSASEISWIGSLQLFLLFIGGLVFGPVFDTKGSKILFVPGTGLFVLSLMMVSLCHKYWQLILAQSLLFGIGDSMLFYPTISSISHWFNRRRGLALGIVVAGSSLGGITWPLILDHLFSTVGFPWALRIVGFICLALLAPASMMVVPRLPLSKGGDIAKEEINAIFKDAPFLLLVAGMFFVMWGMFIPFYYLPLYATEHGLSPDMSNNLIAFLNAGSLVGRVLSGSLADMLGSFNMAIICSMLSGISLLCLHVIKTQTSIIAFTVLYGLFSGGLISLQSHCVASVTKNLEIIGIKIGLMMAICSFGVLTGNPIGGDLVSRDQGQFYGLIDFAGIILLVGTALLIVARCVINREILVAI